MLKTIKFVSELNIKLMKLHQNISKGDPSSQKQSFVDISMKVLCCRYWLLDLWDCHDMVFPFWRIYWNRNMGGVLTHLEDEIEMDPGHMYIISPFTSFSSHYKKRISYKTGIHVSGRHLIVSDEENELESESLIHFFLHFNLGIPFDNVFPGIFKIQINNVFQKKLEYLTHQLKKNNTAFKMTSSLRIQSFVMEVLSSIGPELWKSVNTDSRVLKVIRFIENNIGKKNSNTELAEVINMAPNSFSRLFKENMGVTPHHFLQKRKVAYACELFEYTDKTIEEMAALLGFSDRYHFTRVFTAITGVSPGSYRTRILF